MEVDPVIKLHHQRKWVLREHMLMVQLRAAVSGVEVRCSQRISYRSEGQDSD